MTQKRDPSKRPPRGDAALGQAQVLPGLSLSDPFMIASSHWTSSERSFQALATVSPSALTLKTTSESRGGTGSGLAMSREMRPLRNVHGNTFATYTDGPTELELWDLSTTYDMSTKAKQLLPGTRLGLSVLQGEDYREVCETLGTANYDYIELNWKYTFRRLPGSDPTRGIANIRSDLDAFLEVFADLPILIKLPREALQFLESPEFIALLGVIDSRNAGLIVANSRRTKVPPSRVVSPEPRELSKGVIVGEELFLETYNALRALQSLQRDDLSVPPLVASGGIVDVPGIVDSIAAGAQAVQLCTALDLWGVQAVVWFRSQVSLLESQYGSFADFRDAIRASQETWTRAVLSAKGFELHNERLAEETCRTKEAASYVQDTLVAECLPTGSLDAMASDVDQQSEDAFSGYQAKILVTRGNVISFLLSRRCVTDLGLKPIELENINKFIGSLQEDNFEYDFAIVPERAFHFVKQHRATNANAPHALMEVGVSTIQLVGDQRTPLEEITHVYHFGGISSRSNVGQLLRVLKPRIDQITASKLTPLLRTWPTGAARS